MRTRPASAERGIRRRGVGAGLDAQLVAGGTPGGEVRRHGAESGGDHQHAQHHQRRDRPSPGPVAEHADDHPGGRDPVQQRHQGAGHLQHQRAPRGPTTISTRTPAMPCWSRRTPSSDQATTCATAVAATQPQQQHDLGRRQAAGAEAVRRDAEQHPRLQQPGDVERREQQRAEVVGGGADRVDLRPGRGRAARGRRPTPRPRPRPAPGTPPSPSAAAGPARTPGPHRRRRPACRPAPRPRRRSATTNATASQGAAAAAAYLRGAEPQQVPDVGDRAAYLASPGVRGRHGRPPRRPSGRP